jgi:hypothetical protein
MTLETERPTFRGVICLHCKETIPVPSIVASRQPGSGDEASQRNSQVFNIRCPHCYKEKPYRTREIVNFQGTPEMALTPYAPLPVRWYPQDGMVRAAKA